VALLTYVSKHLEALELYAISRYYSVMGHPP